MRVVLKSAVWSAHSRAKVVNSVDCIVISDDMLLEPAVPLLAYLARGEARTRSSAGARHTVRGEGVHRFAVVVVAQ